MRGIFAPQLPHLGCADPKSHVPSWRHHIFNINSRIWGKYEMLVRHLTHLLYLPLQRYQPQFESLCSTQPTRTTSTFQNLNNATVYGLVGIREVRSPRWLSCQEVTMPLRKMPQISPHTQEWKSCSPFHRIAV